MIVPAVSPMLAAARRSLAAAVALGLLVAGAPAFALYKVIGPDGKVTYTDRADTATQTGKVISMNPDTGSQSASPLPLELRQAVAKYPVLLYVGSSCQPCDIGRAFLNQRGVPFTEKQVLTGDDSDALEKLTGGREAPTLTVGTQVLRGFGADVWGSYLDAAGYPRQSVLPPGYQQAAPTPVVARQATTDVAPPAQRLEPSSTGIPVDPGTAQPPGIQF